MATLKEIFEIEKQRDQQGELNVIHLLRDGNSWKAYEWSAWLCREYAVTDAELQQVGSKRLKPVHRPVKQTSGTVIFVGFPPTSIDKFIPKRAQMDFRAVSDTQVDVAIELPADICGEEPVSAESMHKRFMEWKRQWPVKDDQKPSQTTTTSASKTALDELLELLPHRPLQPMRMSDLLAQLVALPVEDISPNDALKILRVLKRQAAALF